MRDFLFKKTGRRRGEKYIAAILFVWNFREREHSIKNILCQKIIVKFMFRGHIFLIKKLYVYKVCTYKYRPYCVFFFHFNFYIAFLFNYLVLIYEMDTILKKRCHCICDLRHFKDKLFFSWLHSQINVGGFFFWNNCMSVRLRQSSNNLFVFVCYQKCHISHEVIASTSIINIFFY